MGKNILVLGASSAIARASAEAFAEKGYGVYLAGRDEKELERLSSHLHIRYGVPVSWGTFDAVDCAAHGSFFQGVVEKMGGVEGVLLAFGFMGKGDRVAQEPEQVEAVIGANFTGAASLLTHSANYLEERGQGFIIALSSVAGERGRQSNYVYGAAKGGLTAFLQGLRNRLYSSGVHVMTVKPGFVDTAMTYGLPGLFLVAQPRFVGGKILQALEKGKNEIYVPWFWRYIMAIIRSIPETLFKRLKL